MQTVNCTKWLHWYPSPLGLNYPCPSCLHPDSITYWFPPLGNYLQGQRNLWSPQLSPLLRSLDLLPLTLPALFSFLLLYSCSLSPHTVNHACPSRPSQPVQSKLFCSPGNWGDVREACGEGQRGAYLGKSKENCSCCQIQPDMSHGARWKCRREDKQ